MTFLGGENALYGVAFSFDIFLFCVQWGRGNHKIGLYSVTQAILKLNRILLLLPLKYWDHRHEQEGPPSELLFVEFTLYNNYNFILQKMNKHLCLEAVRNNDSIC